jgi:hypothetical protein
MSQSYSEAIAIEFDGTFVQGLKPTNILRLLRHD